MLRPAPNQTRYTPNRTRQTAAILTGALTVVAVAFTTHAAFTPDPSTRTTTNIVQRKVTTPGYDARTDSLNPILMEAARKLQQQRESRHPEFPCRPLHPTHPC